MKFLIENGKIKWNSKGWPLKPSAYLAYNFNIRMNEYNKALARAKAESVPVKDSHNIRKIIAEYNGYFDNKEFYEVPDNEIKKEWL